MDYSLGMSAHKTAKPEIAAAAGAASSESERSKRIGQNIKTVRKAAGLTQERLAEKLGVEQPAVSKWERGTFDSIDTGRLEAIAGVLGVTVAELIGEKKGGKRSGLAASQVMEPREIAPMSGGRVKIPESLEGFLSDHPRLDPAVKWHLESNTDFRTAGWVEKDASFWLGMARFWAERLGVELEPDRGTASGGGSRKS